jgi:hypothetical protein
MSQSSPNVMQKLEDLGGRIAEMRNKKDSLSNALVRQVPPLKLRLEQLRGRISQLMNTVATVRDLTNQIEEFTNENEDIDRRLQGLLNDITQSLQQSPSEDEINQIIEELTSEVNLLEETINANEPSSGGGGMLGNILGNNPRPTLPPPSGGGSGGGGSGGGGSGGGGTSRGIPPGLTGRDPITNVRNQLGGNKKRKTKSVNKKAKTKKTKKTKKRN